MYISAYDIIVKIYAASREIKFGCDVARANNNS